MSRGRMAVREYRNIARGRGVHGAHAKPMSVKVSMPRQFPSFPYSPAVARPKQTAELPEDYQLIKQASTMAAIMGSALYVDVYAMRRI